MAEAIVGPLLSKLQEVVVAEATTLAGVGGSIDSLRDKLMWLHALLHEIEQRRHDTSRFRQVLSLQINEVATEAEDAIDRFHRRADLSRRGLPRAVVRVVNLYTLILARWTIYPKVQSMNARLEEIIDNSGKYGTVFNGPGSSEDDKSWKQSAIRREWLWKNSVPFEMIGRSEEIADLKTKLKDTPSPAVIYVVGDSGMGKRTLLQYAYEDKDIRERFDVRFSVSLQPSIKIVQQIKNQLDILPGKKRFLVWINSPDSITESENKELKSLSTACTDGREIKFMVSATSSQVWMKKDSSSFIELKPLDHAESIALFEYIVNIWERRTSKYIKDGIEKVKNNINDITDGLPLAVVTLAKFMIAMDNFNKWETASNYTMGNINDDKLKVMLQLCIDDLPDEVKLCLLYTAGFPVNTIIDAKMLLRLWTAEGFLGPQQHGMEAEQLGQSYLKELIHRGLLLNKTSPQVDEVQHVAIHDRFLPIFRLELNKRSFMHVNRSGLVVTAPNKTRRIALHNYKNSALRLGECCDKLRTVVSFCHEDMDHPSSKTDGSGEETTKRGGKDDNPPELEEGMRPLLKGSRYLRVINLEGLNIGTDVPDKIGDMVHLRYLGIRCPSLEGIPKSIGKLWSLQTLDVRGTKVKTLPESLWKIKTLLHVLGDGLEIFQAQSEKREETDLSRSNKKKEKSAQKRKDMTDLDSLHTLETVTIQHMDHRWKRRLRLLHRLHVVGLKGSDREVQEDQEVQDSVELKSILEALSCLQSLSLSGDAIPINWLFSSDDPNADTTWISSSSSSSLTEHVKSLELKGELQLRRLGGERVHLKTDELSGYNICLLNLTRLVLRSTRIGQGFINVIAKLPVLAELALLEDSYDGTKVLFCAEGFRRLEALRLSGLLSLEEISGPDEWPVPFIDMSPAKYKTHTPCISCARPATDKKKVQETPEAMQSGKSSIQQENVLHEMILEAIDEGHSYKTPIGDYITEKYGDPLVRILEHMVKCGELVVKMQRNYKIYHLAKPVDEEKQSANDGAANKSPTLPYPEMIRKVIDKNGSSKTAISINFKKKHGDDPLVIILKYMVSKEVLESKTEKSRTEYSRRTPGKNDQKGQHKQDQDGPNSGPRREDGGAPPQLVKDYNKNIVG